MKKFVKILLIVLVVAVLGGAAYHLCPCMCKEKCECECCEKVKALLAKLCPCKK